MAVGHVCARSSIFIIIFIILFLSSLLFDRTSKNITFDSNRCTFFRRISSRCQQRRFPISKWSKRGQTTMAMPDVRGVFAVNLILLSGDIHPQPGPSTRGDAGSNGTTNQGNKSTRNQATKDRKHLMSVAHLNVRSVASRENFHLLKDMIINNKYDIFTISESWLDSTICDADILIPGYTTFRQDRGLHKRGGGLLVYVKNIYKASVIEKWSSISESNFQQLWMNVQYKKFKSFLLCTVYRPPDAPIDFLEDLSKTFVDSLLHGLNVLILGDLNCNVLGTTDPGGRPLINFCSTFGLTQLVKTATRVTEKSESLIDVALTMNENIIYACDVIQSAISDHSLVSLTLKFKTPRPRNTFVTTRTYKNYDRNGFIDDLANVPFLIANIFDDPDDQVNAFNCPFSSGLGRARPNQTNQDKFKAQSIHYTRDQRTNEHA